MRNILFFTLLFAQVLLRAQDTTHHQMDSPNLKFVTEETKDGYVDTLFSIAGVDAPGYHIVWRNAIRTIKVVTCNFEERGGKILPVGKAINYYPTGYNKEVRIMGSEDLPNEGTFEVVKRLSPNNAVNMQVYLINGEWHTTKLHPAGALAFYGVAKRDTPDLYYKESRFDVFGIKMYEMRREGGEETEANFNKAGEKTYSTTTHADGSYTLTSFYKTGTIKSERHYGADKSEQGVWKEYDTEGKVISETQK